MKKVGIIGKGFVGNRLIKKFSTKCDVVSYDKKEHIDYPYDELKKYDFVMICVDTPSTEDGSVFIKNVESAVKDVPNQKILIRSTIPPGTTEYLETKYNKIICFAPEYVGESIFIGSDWSEVETRKPFFILGGTSYNRNFFRDDIEYIFGPDTIIMQMESAEAEMVKYMENSYFALKVAFVNEYRTFAEHLGLDWNSVREGWLLDSRVERDHTAAFKEYPGYGGKCLPKDVNGIINFAKKKKFTLHIMEAVKEYNTIINKDIK